MRSSDDGPRVLAGRYELHRLLGRGGAGEVWAGTDVRLGRPVAVKLVRIPPALDGEAQAETHRRVLREARAAARLDHPAAVTMYDVLDVDGELCLVMELVDAPDLGEVVAAEGPLDPARAARIGLDLLDALEAAHARGLVHRDVKPSNVLVPTTGPARLTDFGTAVIAGEDRLTATGTVFGSPAYMAPEQAVDVDVGPAADLWSLGATLYQAVEGAPPFSGPTAVATMYAVMHSDPRPAQRTGALQPVVDRLLVRDIAARAGVDEVRELLRAVEGSRTAALPRADGSRPAAGGATAAAATGTGSAAGSAGAAGADVAGRGTGSGPEPALADADSGDGAWAPSRAPVVRRRARSRSRMPLAVAAGVVVLLVGAAVLAAIASDDDPGEVAAATEQPSAVTAPTSGADPAATEPVVAPAPPPAAEEPTAVEPTATPTPTPTPTPTEDGEDDGEGEGEDDDEGEGDGQGNGNGNGNGNSNSNNNNNGNGNGQGEDGDAPAVAALPAADVPGNWVAYDPDDAPYVVAHPPQWTAERLDATRTDISDPGSSAYLRLDWTDTPAEDPLADWEAYEPQFAAGREGYERIRMEETTFRDQPAALWEYRYTRNGTTYRAYNLNATDGEYGYALNYQTAESEWEEMAPLFPAFAESYSIG